jgi:beta-lactamase class A
MSIGALAEAAQKTSDGTAANLLVAHLGGPARFTQLLRDLGDSHTRLDRYEPELNRTSPGNVRDTTTPRAMAGTVQRLLVGDALSRASRETLIQWMIETKTGLRRIRAGLPEGWRAGDKTGTGHFPGIANKHNDVAIIWPPKRPPVIMAAYFEAKDYFDPLRPEDETVLADAARVLVAAL